MALTELQLPTKDELYSNLESLAGEVVSRGLRWTEASEFIATIGTADLDAIGVPAGQVRTDMLAFRTALDAVVTAINTNAAAFDKIRRMLVV